MLRKATTSTSRSPAAVHLGGAPLHPRPRQSRSDFVEVEGEPFAVIRDVNALPPFLMSIASDGDFWLFVGSHSAFTAGRVDSDHALFPYQTVDKILQTPDASGTLSIFRVWQNRQWRLWEPWRSSGCVYRLSRNVYKSVYGTSVMFEEINHDLGLNFRWQLTTCERYGLVRKCWLENLSGRAARVQYLDGWHQLIAPNVSQDLYASLSYLGLGYLRHELVAGSRLGVYRLNAAIVDRAEPAESLRAACAWSLGHRRPAVLLSTRQVEAFRCGEPVKEESEVRGQLGAYLVSDRVTLPPRDRHAWHTVADTHLDHASILALAAELKQRAKLERAIEASVTANRDGFRRRMAGADALQQTADPATSFHHFTNVQFNCMRGGTFPDGYRFPGADFAQFVQVRNHAAHRAHKTWLRKLPETMTLSDLHHRAAEVGDARLSRLGHEYMPLTFSRRHGDPSRPWNRFNIHIKDEHGKPVYAYQGNWRDIFQNWESLGQSYPGYLRQMITVFLNASTADGYNPYRISREGIDWEAPEPHNPWAYIGYWGDHQIIYLLRLLESQSSFAPGQLAAGLADTQYVYAQVPYEIRNFEQLLANPRDSVHFNHALHHRILDRSKKMGGDGKLLLDARGEPVRVSLAEKLLVPVLAKLSNLAPGGGIWLNTQRPEWNDANNALAGWGLSVVTTGYLRRYLTFLDATLAESESQDLELTASAATFLRDLARVFDAGRGYNKASRFRLMKELGRAGEKHRRAVYGQKLGPPSRCAVKEVRAFIRAAMLHVDATLRANRRDDGLYHSYNVLHVRAATANIEYLYPMLEGQVSVLSSGLLSPDEGLALLQQLAASPLYRPDQQSYMLYPDRELPSFAQLNRITRKRASRIPLIRRLAGADERSVVMKGRAGDFHFHADIQNAAGLAARLDRLGKEPRWKTEVQRHRTAMLELWEELFHHSAFTGRSGTFFTFEGLGCIYWHMVVKLLLAVQELYHAALHDGADTKTVRGLAAQYDKIRAGLGFTKTPDEYGAFPTDPYSHTPRHTGAQQPGMTGQVKEEILTRWGELGIRLQSGQLQFAPRLLHRAEFMAKPHVFAYVDVSGRDQRWALPAGTLAFTYNQVPVCYQLADKPAIVVEWIHGHHARYNGNGLDSKDTEAIVMRTGAVSRITVLVPTRNLRP